MEAVYLDTHAVARLHSGRTDSMNRRALEIIDRCDPLISPVVLLELQYLYEVGKIAVSAMTLFKRLETSLGLRVCDKAFYQVVSGSLNIQWTRDPFDRLITAHAALDRTPLVTQDEKILRHYDRAVW